MFLFFINRRASLLCFYADFLPKSIDSASKQKQKKHTNEKYMKDGSRKKNVKKNLNLCGCRRRIKGERDEMKRCTKCHILSSVEQAKGEKFPIISSQLRDY